MNENLKFELNQLVKEKDVSHYWKNQKDNIFHISEAATCSHKVIQERLTKKYQHPDIDKNVDGSAKFNYDKSFFVLGRAFEKQIVYKIIRQSRDKPYRFIKQYPCYISMNKGGFRGSIDLVFQDGQEYIPIEIKTTNIGELSYYSSQPKLNIQGAAYAFGIGSSKWILLAASKSSDEFRWIPRLTNCKIKIREDSYSIDTFLPVKFRDLIEKQNFFSPMFDWECENRNGKCAYFKKCSYRKR